MYTAFCYRKAIKLIQNQLPFASIPNVHHRWWRPTRVGNEDDLES